MGGSQKERRGREQEERVCARRRCRLFVLFRNEEEVIGLVLDGVVGRDLEEGWVGFGAREVSEFVSGFADTGVDAFCHDQDFEIGGEPGFGGDHDGRVVADCTGRNGAGVFGAFGRNALDELSAEIGGGCIFYAVNGELARGDNEVRRTSIGSGHGEVQGGEGGLIGFLPLLDSCLISGFGVGIE